MVLQSELAQREPVLLRADKIEKEIDRDLNYHLPLFKRQSVAYRYDIKCVPEVKALAIELARRYKESGWKVDILKLSDREGRWYSATLEFRGEEESK